MNPSPEATLSKPPPPPPPRRSFWISPSVKLCVSVVLHFPSLSRRRADTRQFTNSSHCACRPSDLRAKDCVLSAGVFFSAASRRRAMLLSRPERSTCFLTRKICGRVRVSCVRDGSTSENSFLEIVGNCCSFSFEGESCGTRFLKKFPEDS